MEKEAERRGGGAMTPAGYALSLENAADMLAEALRDAGYSRKCKQPMQPNTRKAILRTMETLGMILEGDIREPLEMAAEVEGRVSE